MRRRAAAEVMPLDDALEALAAAGADGGYVIIRKAVAAKREAVPQVEKATKTTVAKKAKK